MTPPLNADDVCGGCFLYERRGVCPAARDAYGLQNSTVAERRAEQFRQAVARDAQSIVTLAELVRRDAQRHRDAQRQRPARLLPTPSPLALPKAAAERTTNDSRKKVIRVFASGSPR
jgi:hypothetical protein